MRDSRNETITRLEGFLREVECELLYLINDICVETTYGRAAEPPVRQLEIARHCVSAAVQALRVEEPEPAELYAANA